MGKIFRFKDGIIEGYKKDIVVSIIPQLETYFKQRKNFYEYYFQETNVILTLDQLNQLADNFDIHINQESITIQ